VNQIFLTVITKAHQLFPSSEKPIDFTSANKNFNIILPPTSISYM